MAKQPLTDPQKQLYDWIVAYLREHGYPPTIREMKEGMGLYSPSGIQARLDQLRDKGWVTWIERKPRTVRPTEGDETELPYSELSERYRVAQDELAQAQTIIQGKNAELAQLRALLKRYQEAAA